MFPAISDPPSMQNALPYVIAIPHGTGRASEFSLVLGNPYNVKELGSRFSIYDSILAYHPEDASNSDFGWFRGPMMMVAIVLFAVWQVTNKRRGKGSSFGSNSNLFDSQKGIRDFSHGNFGSFGTGDFRNRMSRGNTMSAEEMFRHSRSDTGGRMGMSRGISRGNAEIDFMGRPKPHQKTEATGEADE